MQTHKNKRFLWRIMEKEYWENYYLNHKEPSQESPFAKFISKYLEKNKSLIELGCGNGRDSLYFSKLGLNVVGIDQCKEEILHLNQKFKSKNLSFKTEDFTNLPLKNKYDFIYSRFTLHSIKEDAEDRVLNWTYNALNQGGKFLLELRSIKDDMFNRGKKLSEYETKTDHYRRFANFNKLKTKLKQIGFSIEYSIEARGLAIHKNEDPIVIRFVAKK